jgi:hypothetical protein
LTQLPETLIIGMIEGQWPVHVFTAEAHALHCVSEDPTARQVWEIEVADPVRLRFVPPTEPRLERSK